MVGIRHVLIKPLQLLALLVSFDGKVLGYGIDIRHDVGYVIDVLLSLPYYVGHEVSVSCHAQLFV